MKKILSLILAAILTVACLPTVVWATDETDTPEAQRPVIEVWNDNGDGEAKVTFASLLGTTLAENTTYKLMENIDLGGTEQSTGYIKLSNGVVFDGQGKSVVGFSLTDGKESALFDAVSGESALENITFGRLDAPIAYTHSGNKYSGYIGFALVSSTAAEASLSFKNCTAYVNGACKGGEWQDHSVFLGRNNGAVSFESCTANGSLSGHGMFGAFVGTTKDGSSVKITGCVNNTDLTVDGGGYFGGFIGRAERSDKRTTVEITGSLNNGKITAEIAVGGFVGEILGNAELYVLDCVNNGKITGKKSTGGVVGLLTLGLLSVKRYTNFKDITATDGGGDAGAIVGYLSAPVAYVTAESCVNYGNVTAKNGMVGGVVGKVMSKSGDILLTDITNAGKLNSSSAAAVGIGNAENGDNSELKITAERIINTESIYGRWNAATVVGYSKYATLTIKNCINSGTVTTSDNKADGFAKFEKAPESEDGETDGEAAEAKYATVTAEGNVFITDTALNNTKAKNATAVEALSLITAEGSKYNTSAVLTLNKAKNRIISIVPPMLNGAQIKTNADGSLTVRIIGTVNTTSIQAAGFKLTVNGEEQTALESTTTMTELKQQNPDGTVTALSPETISGSATYASIYASTLNIPEAIGSYKLELTPFIRMADGTEYTGMSYTAIIIDGQLVSAEADALPFTEEALPEEPDFPPPPDQGETGGGGTTGPENPDEGETDDPIDSKYPIEEDDGDFGELEPPVPVRP